MENKIGLMVQGVTKLEGVRVQECSGHKPTLQKPLHMPKPDLAWDELSRPMWMPINMATTSTIQSRVIFPEYGISHE